jgi:hypothetical protein
MLYRSSTTHGLCGFDALAHGGIREQEEEEQGAYVSHRAGGLVP